MNAISQEDDELLRKLEESLWISDSRFNSEYMDHILSIDFFEFGRSGRIYKREDTLSVPRQEINALLPLKSFTIHPISKDVVLITYISHVKYERLEIGNRSSIWSKTNGRWQLRFHQGTPAIQD
jgi:hypothetical protein